MKHARLYHKTSKGNINIWDIRVEGDTIFTRWGQKDGKIQEAQKKCKGKNIGKANQTSSEDQAISEALSMWTKKRDQKYYESEEEALNERVFLPMLAESFDKRKKFLKEENFPVLMQPKLDGLRCLAYWDNNEVKLMSRGGKEYLLPHIILDLKDSLPKDVVLDGELYIHGESLQELNRLIRGAHKYDDSVRVEYHVYDYISDIDNTAEERISELQCWYDRAFLAGTCIVEVPTVAARDVTAVLSQQSVYVNDGYEGGIVRLTEGLYRFGYRSKELLKVKSFQDAEFKIIKYTNGVGKFTDCIIYTCETLEGKTFDVVPKGTFEQRSQWLKEGDSHIGRYLKVQFAQYTEDGLPQFPVGLSIRLEEDM